MLPVATSIVQPNASTWNRQPCWWGCCLHRMATTPALTPRPPWPPATASWPKWNPPAASVQTRPTAPAGPPLSWRPTPAAPDRAMWPPSTATRCAVIWRTWWVAMWQPRATTSSTPISIQLYKTWWSACCGKSFWPAPGWASAKGLWWCSTAATAASWRLPGAGITTKASSTGPPWPRDNRAAPSS